MAIGGGVIESLAATLARQRREHERLNKRAELNLGPVLRRHREQAGLSLRAVERRTGVSPGFLSLLERGDREGVSVSYLVRLCTAYGVSIEDVIREAFTEDPVTEWERAFESFVERWSADSGAGFRRELTELLHLVRKDERSLIQRDRI